jgi:ribonuclease HII
MTLRLPLSQPPREWRRFELSARREGYAVVAGLDEVGRGCLAGPVVAAAVVLPERVSLPGVDDSKKLSPQRREALFHRISDAARAIGIGQASAAEIDEINILRATQLAMCRALEQLVPPADFLLIDGITPLPLTTPQRTIIKGDSLCLSIAAASIMAKVTRDRWMTGLAEQYPVYGFERHKGYGTAEHLSALEQHGPCVLHRRSFRGVVLDEEGASEGAALEAMTLPLSVPPRGTDGARRSAPGRRSGGDGT